LVLLTNFKSIFGKKFILGKIYHIRDQKYL